MSEPIPPTQPQYSYAPQEPRGLSIASLVLGIASVFFGFTFIVPIIGTILGFIGYRREPAGKGFAIAGIIINLLVLVGWVIAVIILIAVLGLAGIFGWAASSSYGY